MKKALMIVAIVAIVAVAGSMIYYFVFFRPGIERAGIEKQFTKTYIIISWSVDKNALKEAQNDLDIANTAKLVKSVNIDILKTLAEKKIQDILDNPQKQEVKAKKIIDSTSTSVRFIDLYGNERFITADKIEIQ